jgi:hypothetical protein
MTMMCWRFDLRRSMVSYLEGRLTGSKVARLERHLLDCGTCRALLVRLRAGHKMAQRLAELPLTCVPEADLEPGPLPWDAAVFRGRTGAFDWRDRLERLATPRTVTVLAALVLLQLGLLVVSNRGVMLGERNGATVSPGAIDFSEFRQIPIADIKLNTQPHVAMEGYVEDVHSDQEEGTVAFKLVGNPQDAGSFVVCEIMAPIRLAPPRKGSRVRVYGVARYDAQQDRKWYEVNPVLDIVPLNR